MSTLPSARANHVPTLTVGGTLIWAVFLGGACNPKKPGPIVNASNAQAEAQLLPEGMPFKDMNKEQRGAFMEHVVLPTMKPIFQSFDADKFSEVNCRTCHGKGAENHTFKMPDAEIARLPQPENFAAFAQDPEHAPWVQFMAEKVKPTMAKLLGMTEFDPATHTGEFGCYACHMKEGEESVPSSGGTH
jgi:hypothetical protein